MRKNDDICGAYRIHGIAYIMGTTIKKIIGELCAKQNGSSHGKGGSAHMYAHHFYGGHGIVGAQVFFFYIFLFVYKFIKLLPSNISTILITFNEYLRVYTYGM